MTTNETYWFRDVEPYAIFKDVLLPKFAKEIALGKRSAIKIWSAACSTGQEPYSLAMCALDYMRGNPALKPAHIQITATDISPTVLFLARAARYDSLAMSRGLPPETAKRLMLQAFVAEAFVGAESEDELLAAALAALEAML